MHTPHRRWPALVASTLLIVALAASGTACQRATSPTSGSGDTALPASSPSDSQPAAQSPSQSPPADQESSAAPSPQPATSSPLPFADITVPIPEGAEVRLTAVQEVQIARDLLGAWLGKHKDPGVAEDIRLTDFRIDEDKMYKIEGDESNSRLVFRILYAVRPAGSHSWWMASSGALQPDGWLEDKVVVMTVVRDGDVYRIEGMGNGSP